MKNFNLMKFKSLLLTVLLILTFLLVTGCGSGQSQYQLDFTDNGEEYEIKMLLYINSGVKPTNVVAVERELNKILKEKINATIKIDAIVKDNYNTAVGNEINAAAKFDLCFTSPDINAYAPNVKKRAFIALDNLLPTYAPETYNAIPKEIWEQAKIDGHIFGAVNEQIFPRAYAYKTDADYGAENLSDFLAEKYNGILPEQIYMLSSLSDGSEYTPFGFMEEYLKWLKLNGRGYGGKISKVEIEPALLTWYGYDDLGSGMKTPGAVKVTDGTYTVVNQFESADFKELIDTIYRWDSENYLDELAPNQDLITDSTWKPGYLEGRIMKLSEGRYFTSYVIGSMNAISATSKNPARVMKFIELMRTNEDVHNLLQYGVENISYVLKRDEQTGEPVEPKRIESFINSGGYDNREFGWGLGTEFNSYLVNGQSDDNWDKVKEINEQTPMGELIGFTFNSDGYELIIQNCMAIVQEYLPAFENANYALSEKDAKIAEFIGKLKSAGADRLIQAKQEQLNKFLDK